MAKYKITDEQYKALVKAKSGFIRERNTGRLMVCYFTRPEVKQVLEGLESLISHVRETERAKGHGRFDRMYKRITNFFTRKQAQ